MLVRFHTQAYGDVTMFGDAAVALLRLAGHSGTVPGAFVGDDVGHSAVRLKRALVEQASESSTRARTEEDDDTRPPVSLRQRAYTLIELLEAAAREGCDVTWSEVKT